MAYFVHTFGCQMNMHDSRRIGEVLRAEGHAPASSIEDADLIVVNTCSVRDKAVHKLMSMLGRMRPLRESRPDLLIAVTGCVAQQEGERLLRHARHVDLVLGPDCIAELPALVAAARAGAPPAVRIAMDHADPRFLGVPAPTAEATAFVTVMKGCDERCTFCIVPTTRGSERYRAADDIVAEVQALAEAGTAEVTLLGQTVNSWHEPGADCGDSQFPSLLRRIARDAPALTRLRYTSPHPRHLTDALVRAHGELPLLCAHLHLPAQSGSNRVLRRMSRHYSREHYVRQVAALVAARPGLTLSTDLIVGFPGESEKDFEETLSFVREVGFVAAFAFKYSPRPGTPALQLGDDVTEEVKSERLVRLFVEIERQQCAHLDALVGATVQVLVEGPGRGGAGFVGRSERHEIVHLATPEGLDPTGTLVQATVTWANKHSLLASMAGALALPPPSPRRRLSVLGAPEGPTSAAGVEA